MAATLALDHDLETKQVSFDLADLIKMYDFTGTVVAVTGGAGILGSEMARALAGCGAQVAILDINLDPAKELVESMGPRGKQFSLFHCNVLNRESIAQAAQEVVNRMGKIDCLINGAGGNKPAATTSDEVKFFGETCLLLKLSILIAEVTISIISNLGQEFSTKLLSSIALNTFMRNFQIIIPI